MTISSYFYCIDMICIIFTSICFNTFFCTCWSCCYNTIIPSMIFCAFFFCINDTTCTFIGCVTFRFTCWWCTLLRSKPMLNIQCCFREHRFQICAIAECIYIIDSFETWIWLVEYHFVFSFHTIHFFFNFIHYTSNCTNCSYQFCVHFTSSNFCFQRVNKRLCCVNGNGCIFF